jgi:Xaa-Pro aminopeptidase
MPEIEKNSEASGNNGRQEPTPYHYAALDTFSYKLHQYLKNGYIMLVGEYELYKQPMVVDILVIKMNRNIEIAFAWAKIFRQHNIIEYKSPADNPPTLAVFNKLIGYAYTYAAKEEVQINNVTATLICAQKPEKLFETLEKELDYEISQKDDGIYYIIQKGVTAEKNLAVQIVTQESELLLQALDKGTLDNATIDKIACFLATADEEITGKLGFWFRAISPENFKLIAERMKNMKSMRTEQEVKMIMEAAGLYDEAVGKGRQEGKQEGRQEGKQEGWQEGLEEEKRRTARAMLARRMDIDTISQITGLAEDEIRRM